MSFMKAYVDWAAEQIHNDYPALSWITCMNMVVNTTVCNSIERYSMESYVKARDKEKIGGIK